jgi:hypothetical protein
MKTFLILILFLLMFTVVFSQELVISGVQDSRISCTLEQKINIPDGIKRITVSFVEPANFESPTYRQDIEDIDFNFNLKPDDVTREQDTYANKVRRFTWNSPQENISVSVSVTARLRVSLDSVKSSAGFPMYEIPAQCKPFLEPTAQVQSDHPEIITLARELTGSSRTEIEAVRSVLHFTVDHMRYTLVPEKFDALYALHTGSGNCQNYSHLAAALLRASGIPARIVNGITLKKNFRIPVDQSEYSFEMADGRHSWIEVYFPDMGWLPFDAQQTEYFVINRYLRVEVGRDNNETIKDGLVKWVAIEQAGTKPPSMAELISTDFLKDDVSLAASERIAGLKKLLLTPPVYGAIPSLVADQTIAVALERPLPSDTVPESDLVLALATEPDYSRMRYEVPFVAGNLDFPRGYDFLASRLAEKTTDAGSGELKRNFVVETAEYVTGKKQFGQLFIIDEPIYLQKISLALHSFGGEGIIWLELSEDEKGMPGTTAARSLRIATGKPLRSNGYDWVDFDFSGEGLILSPGRYWFFLNYSGSPIVNWFYTYGKTVGPVEGTRSRNPGQDNWNTVLTYEFNYRISGNGTEDYPSKP